MILSTRSFWPPEELKRYRRASSLNCCTVMASNISRFTSRIFSNTRHFRLIDFDLVYGKIDLTVSTDSLLRNIAPVYYSEFLLWSTWHRRGTNKGSMACEISQMHEGSLSRFWGGCKAFFFTERICIRMEYIDGCKMSNSVLPYTIHCLFIRKLVNDSTEY